MRRIERLRALGAERLGFVPAFLNAEQDSDGPVDSLWEQTLLNWVESPLPALFREKLAAYLGRYTPHPYCIVCHSCALRQMGMRAAQVLDLLTQPLPTEAECRTQSQLLTYTARGRWPDAGSPQETALFVLSVAVYMRMDMSGVCRTALRSALSPRLAGHLWSLLAYIRTVQEWVEAHPEISYGHDERARHHLQALLAEEPVLASVFEGCDATSRAARQDYEQRLVSDLAHRERAVRSIDGKALRLRSTMLHAPFPVMIYAEDGQVVQVNDVWTELSGYGSHEIATMEDWCSRAQPGTEPHTRQDIDALYESDQRVEEGEQTVVTRYGTELIWDFTSVPLGLLADGRRAVLRMAADVTEHRQLEISLWRTKERMLEILESITDGFFALDGQWQFVYVNERAEQLLERRREDLIGRNAWEVLLHAGETGFRADAERAVAEMGTVHSEKQLPSGRWFEWHLYPSREGLAVHFRDVTERVHMADALREANQKLEALVRASPVSIVVIDLDGSVRLWNPASHRLFGWTEGEVLGKPLPVVPPERLEEFRNNRSRLLEGRTMGNALVPCLRKDGSQVLVYLSIAPVLDDSGRLRSLLGIMSEHTGAEPKRW